MEAFNEEKKDSAGMRNPLARTWRELFKCPFNGRYVPLPPFEERRNDSPPANDRRRRKTDRWPR